MSDDDKIHPPKSMLSVCADKEELCLDSLKRQELGLISHPIKGHWLLPARQNRYNRSAHEHS